MPMTKITYKKTRFFDGIAAKDGEPVHLILIATKPDIIKPIPLY